MANYVFYPLSHVLNKDEIGDRVMELVLQCLEFILKYGWSSSLPAEKARELLAVILYFLSGSPQEKSPTKVFLSKSNEARLAGCNTIICLVTAAVQSSSHEAMKAFRNHPMVAHCVTVVLDCIQYGKDMIQLQLTAIECLNVLLFNVMVDPDQLAMVVPGVVSLITKLLNGKFGMFNFKVAAGAIDLLGLLLSTVYSDSDLALLDMEKEEAVGVGEQTAPPNSVVISDTNRTASWLKGSKEQVRMSLNTIITIRSHQRIEVQKAMLRMCQRLLDNSSRSLDVCLPCLVDTVVFYTEQDGALSDIAEPYLSTKMSISRSIKATVQDRVNDWIDSIPRLFTSHDDKMPVLVIKSITTGIRLLETNGVDSQALREGLMHALTSSIAVETTGPSSSRSASMMKFDPSKMLPADDDKTVRSMVSFDNLGVVSNLSSDTQRWLVNLLQNIGKMSHGIELFQNTIQQFETATDSKVRLNSLWMATNLLKGATGKQEEADDDIDNWLVTDDPSEISSGDLSDAVYDALTVSHDIIERGTSAKLQTQRTDQNNTVEASIVSIALDALAVVARYMGTEFEHELVDNIFPVVSYLGSPNGFVRQQAQKTISQIAESGGYENVRDLLVKNADYLVDGVSIKLNTLDITPQTATILSTLIELAGPSIAPYMDDLVATMFVILDNYHGYTLLTEGIFKVFQTLVKETSKGYKDKLIIDGHDHDESKLKNKGKLLESYEEVIRELEYKAEEPELTPLGPESHNSKPFERFKEVDSDDDGEDSEPEEEPEHGDEPMENAEESEESEWKSPLARPAYITIKRIVSYADLYLTHSSAQLRFNLLRVINEAIPLLSTTEKEFLPAVNEYWPVVASKLDDSEIFVLVEALDTIGKTCEHAKTFMSQRIEQIWPKILSLLPSRIVKMPQFSDEKKRFDATVDCIARIIANTPIPETAFDAFVKYMAPVLVTGGNVKLLHQFDHVRQALDKVNPDAVWLECVKLEASAFTQRQQTPVSSLTPPVEFYPVDMAVTS